MSYSYDRRVSAALSGKEAKLWKDVEDFLYPSWYKGSGYRGDIEYTVYVRLIEEFYQSPESLSEDDRDSVPDALARAKADNDKQWRERRQDALETIQELPDPSNFSRSDVHRYMHDSTLDRLVYEGALEKSGSGFRLVSADPRKIKTASFLIDKLSVEVDVNLYPEKLSWGTGGSVIMTGRAEFVLPNQKHKSEPYELEVSEDGSVQKCGCPDPLQRQLIWMAAKARKKDLAELIVDQKDRGSLRKKP